MRFHQRLQRSLQGENSGYRAGEIPGVVSVREDVLCENLLPLVGWAQDDIHVGGPAGGPLGPLLFCLAIHPVLTEVAKQVVAEFPDLTVEGVFKLVIFYQDDGYVVAKHAVLIRLGEVLAPHPPG
jgi:hypothetical protein